SEENRITPLEALRVFTAHAAWSVFEEKHKGTLERGKQADFVVLAEDPTQPGVAIKDIRIVRTVHRGQDVYLDGQTSNPMRGQG
ncbi:MAG: amidohydrolase family protein, partial [Anaerolineae bacterium]